MLGRLKWWNFVDWPDEFDDGRPPMDKDGQSSMLSLQFAAGLRSAADLEEAYGSKELAAHDRALAAKIASGRLSYCAGIPRASWSQTRQSTKPSANMRISWPCSRTPFPRLIKPP